MGETLRDGEKKTRKSAARSPSLSLSRGKSARARCRENSFSGQRNYALSGCLLSSFERPFVLRRRGCNYDCRRVVVLVENLVFFVFFFFLFLLPLSLFLSRFIFLAGRNFHAVARNRSTIDLVEDEEEDYEVC